MESFLTGFGVELGRDISARFKEIALIGAWECIFPFSKEMMTTDRTNGRTMDMRIHRNVTLPTKFKVRLVFKDWTLRIRFV